MCNCGPHVTMQGYENQETVDIPPHMESYRLARRAAGLTELISIDRCILPEIQALWALGIHTRGSCCGHNAQCSMINVRPEDDARMVDLGYIRWENIPEGCCRETFFAKSIPMGAKLPVLIPATPAFWILDLNAPAAPQAQEETRGAPAPGDRAGLAETFRGVLREYDAKSLDENEAIEEIFGAIRDFRQPQPQPPAPASPAAPWAEYTKAPVPDLNHVYWLVWAARHMVAVCAGRDADIATVSDQAKLLGVLLAKHFANIPDVVGSKAITPAEPEAGGPA